MNPLYLKENYYALLLEILAPRYEDENKPEKPVKKEIYKRLTKEDLETMLKMKEQGISLGKIAIKYGMSYKAVFERLKRYKVG